MKNEPVNNEPMLYDDGRIGCSETNLVVRRYYPWGTAKKIPYASIRSVTRRPLSTLTGKWAHLGLQRLRPLVEPRSGATEKGAGVSKSTPGGGSSPP